MTGVSVTVRHCLTRRSHSLRLQASRAEPRIPKGYSLGAPSAPPRSPTLSPIGRQRRPRLSLLEVTEAAACQDPTFPSISRRENFPVRFGFAETRDGILAFGFLPSLGPSAHPSGSMPTTFGKPGRRATETREGAVPSPRTMTPRRPRDLSLADNRRQPHSFMGNVVQDSYSVLTSSSTHSPRLWGWRPRFHGKEWSGGQS